jgi:hypothetical protein
MDGCFDQITYYSLNSLRERIGYKVVLTGYICFYLFNNSITYHFQNINSQHPKSGQSRFRMVANRTFFCPVFKCIRNPDRTFLTASLDRFILKKIFFMTIFFINGLQMVGHLVLAAILFFYQSKTGPDGF